MPTEKNMTGYPSIDKPWLKYYEQERKEFHHTSIYDYLKESNKDNLHLYAMRYLGRKFTYLQMFEHIESLSSVFIQEGIKEKDKVVILALNTPDTICAIYALNKIGAVACIEYVTQKEISLGKVTDQYDAKYAVVLDLFYEKYVDVLLENGVQKVFLTKLSDSMPAFLKAASSLKKVAIKKESTILLERERKRAIHSNKSYDWSGDETAIILSTSGTTGIPKRAELSCNAINALAYQGSYVDLDLKPSRTILTPAPPFLAFGISLTTHMPLCNGVCLILSPSPDPDFVGKQFIKNKPNLFMGGHVFLDKIMNNKKIQKMDLSFVKVIEIGGEAVAPDYLCEVNTFLKEHNSIGGAYVGYGMTELSGCSTTESKSARRSGSVGIPLCDVNVKAVDIESKKEVPYNSKGEICISSPCMMNGYFNNQEVTGEMIEIDENGIRWIRTGDLGKIDSDGFVYIIGRIKRIDVTVDPETNAQVKLYPDYIEYLLNSINVVERSAVVIVDHPERMRVPVAFVKWRDDCKGDIDELDAYFSANTESYNKPVKYCFVRDFPVLPNGKIDYQSLLKELDKTND